MIRRRRNGPAWRAQRRPRCRRRAAQLERLLAPLRRPGAPSPAQRPPPSHRQTPYCRRSRAAHSHGRKPASAIGCVTGNRLCAAAGRGRAVSPRYNKSALGNALRSADKTVRPPTPESKLRSSSLLQHQRRHHPSRHITQRIGCAVKDLIALQPFDQEIHRAGRGDHPTPPGSSSSQARRNST